MAFKSKTTTFRGRLLLAVAVEDAFPLFSPAGERLWVPGWDPELLYPSDSEWDEGQIFRTQEETGEAVWVTTRLERAQHRAEYYRVEPGRYVAHVAVRCRAASEQSTEVSVAYSFVGLSDTGNRDIAAMTQEAYDAKMSRWTEWLNAYLEKRET